MIVSKINYNSLQEIFFKENFNNKLHNKCFSSIRLADPNKYKLNADFAIQTKQEKTTSFFGIARIVSIKEITIDQITDEMALLDTGLSRKDLVKLILKAYSGQIKDLSTTFFQYIIFEHLTLQQYEGTNN